MGDGINQGAFENHPHHQLATPPPWEDMFPRREGSHFTLSLKHISSQKTLKCISVK